ncbi:hypothetical protein ATOBIA_N10540 [Atopobiaceae bacterium P1]|nr:hypothetical protein ATOBIA_N10540 [Atopobiaceae bacterium P1]
MNTGTRTEDVLSNAVVPQLKTAKSSRYIQDLQGPMKKAVCGAKMQKSDHKKSDNASAYLVHFLRHVPTKYN